jgi:PadR family transcriptional regulator, regulatory protein PadR
MGMVEYYCPRHSREKYTMGRKVELLQGTLDMLILKTLELGPRHGYSVAERIEQVSREVLQVEEGSLYPALHRLAKRGWIKAEWGLSENNRKAKFYSLSNAGKKRLQEEAVDWASLSEAITRVMRTA